MRFDLRLTELRERQHGVGLSRPSMDEVRLQTRPLVAGDKERNQVQDRHHPRPRSDPVRPGTARPCAGCRQSRSAVAVAGVDRAELAEATLLQGDREPNERDIWQQRLRLNDRRGVAPESSMGRRRLQIARFQGYSHDLPATANTAPRQGPHISPA